VKQEKDIRRLGELMKMKAAAVPAKKISSQQVRLRQRNERPQEKRRFLFVPWGGNAGGKKQAPSLDLAIAGSESPKGNTAAS